MRRASSIPQHTAVDEYEGCVLNRSLDDLPVSCIATICPFRAATPTVCVFLILLHVVTPFPFYSPLYVFFEHVPGGWGVDDSGMDIASAACGEGKWFIIRRHTLVVHLRDHPVGCHNDPNVQMHLDDVFQ